MLHLPITNDKRQRGAKSLGDQVPNLDLLEFDAVFDREFYSDVHFVTYNLVDPSADGLEPHPRLNKPVLTHVREAGGDIVTVAIALDCDLKDQDGAEHFPLDAEGKPCWNDEALQAFIDGLRDIDRGLIPKRIAAPLVYTTTHGARFVHRLLQPVPVDTAEDLIRGLIEVYADLGVVMDSACCDWTRLFRAPKVRRGNSNTWTQRWFWLRWGAGVTDPRAIPPKTKQQAHHDRYSKIEPIYRDRPTPEQAHERLYVDAGNGQWRKTAMHKLAERILKGTDCYGPLFENRPLAETGQRDQTLIRLVGQATTFLLGPQAKDFTFEPEDIYALFLGPVEDLEPDVGTPDWSASLWSKVKNCVERERAKIAAQVQQQDAKREQAATEARSLLDVVRDTCGLPELWAEDEYEVQSALRRLMLIKEPSGRFRAMYVRGPQMGTYTQAAFPQNSLHHLLGNIVKLDDHIERFVADKNGNWREINENALARRATDIVRVCGGAGVKGSHVTGDAWDDLTLRIALYRRNPDLVPEFNPLVDEWLDELTSQPKLLKRWLAYALDFEGGAICALSLAGAPGAGKGMLCQGLVETLEQPVRADKMALVSRFNSTLRNTPFLIVDEGLPKGDHDIADKFRVLTAGEPITTEEKYQTPIEIRNPMRIVFTANNLQVVQQLASERMNDGRDQSALAIRLLHLDVPASAERYLRVRGGLDYTRGWVEGANGSPSDFVVAKHLLYLYETRDEHGEPGKRFLVEGVPDTAVVQSLRITGSVPEAIAAALLNMLENPTPAISENIAIDDYGQLYVTAGAIVQQHKLARDARETHVQLTPCRVGHSMTNLTPPGVEGSIRMRLDTVSGHTNVQNRWWPVDLRLLWRYAEAAGYPRKRLAQLVREVHGEDGFDNE